MLHLQSRHSATILPLNFSLAFYGDGPEALRGHLVNTNVVSAARNEVGYRAVLNRTAILAVHGSCRDAQASLTRCDDSESGISRFLHFLSRFLPKTWSAVRAVKGSKALSLEVEDPHVVSTIGREVGYLLIDHLVTWQNDTVLQHIRGNTSGYIKVQDSCGLGNHSVYILQFVLRRLKTVSP